MSLGSPFGTLNTPKSTKFTTIKPGSVVEVHDRRTPEDSMLATVLESRAEYGPSAIPALLLRPHGEDMEPSMLIFSDGNWVVSVITDSSVLAAREPDGLLTFLPKPVERQALRYVGGLESAEQVILWAAGSAVITYHSGTSSDSEHLSLVSLTGDSRINIGDYLTRGQDGKFHAMTQAELDADFDIREAVAL